MTAELECPVEGPPNDQPATTAGQGSQVAGCGGAGAAKAALDGLREHMAAVTQRAVERINAQSEESQQRWEAVLREMEERAKARRQRREARND